MLGWLLIWRRQQRPDSLELREARRRLAELQKRAGLPVDDERGERPVSMPDIDVRALMARHLVTKE